MDSEEFGEFKEAKAIT